MVADGGRTFEILGSLAVRRGTQPVPLRSPLQRKVLAALLVADRSVPSDELIDVLWGERPPATALGTLQTHVSRLRTALDAGSDLLPSDASGYRLQVAPTEVDARRFTLLVSDGTRAHREGRSGTARSLLVEALGLWRGPALVDFRYEPFAQTEITRLESLRLTALEHRIGLDLEAGLHAEACTELEVLVREHPLHEELHAMLMVALYRSGRQADALAAYSRLRTSLRDELGLEPTPQLRALELDILGHAPTLVGVGHRPVTTPAEGFRTTPTLEPIGWIEHLEVPALDDRMRGELLLARGDGQRRAGKEQDARRTFAAAVRLAASNGSTDQLAAGALGLAGPPEDTLLGEPLDESLMEQAIRALPENGPAVTMLRARLAVALVDRGDADRGARMADAAVALARSVDDAESLAYALRARHRTWFDPTAHAERLELSGELVDLGHRLSDPEVLAWGHRWRSIDLLEVGELAACRHELDVLERLASQLHDAFHWWGVIVRRAGLALLTGPPDEAEPLVMEALALADQIHSPYTVAASLTTLWALRWQQGRLDEIEETILTIEELSPAHAFLVPFQHQQLGRRDQTARTYEVLARDGFASVAERDTVGVTRLFSLSVLGEVASYLRDVTRAPLLYQELVPFAGRLAVVHPGLTAVGPVDQALGQLSALMGDRRRSDEHFEAALATCREIGAGTLEVRTMVAQAGTLLDDDGDSASTRRSEQLLVEAAAAASELGLGAFDAVVRSVARRAVP